MRSAKILLVCWSLVLAASVYVRCIGEMNDISFILILLASLSNFLYFLIILRKQRKN